MPEEEVPTTPQPQTNPNEDIVLDISGDTSTAETQASTGPTTVMGLYDYLNDWVINNSPVSLRDKLLFFQLFGSMVGAGISVVKALQLLESQTKNLKFARVLKDMRESVEAGDSLAIAMQRNDDIFAESTYSVVEAGEKSGRLQEVLKELVFQFERLNTLTGKVKSVMTYPAIVLVVMLILVVIVLIFVVPRLTDLFGGQANLPTPTRILIGMSDFAIHQWALLLGIVFGFVFGFIFWKRSDFGSRQWSGITLSIPIIGDILQKMILSRITRVFAFLVASGVPMVESLRISSHTTTNSLYQEKMLLAADDLTKGISIAENLSDDESLFPEMLVSMIAIGEKTASLDSILMKAADFYDEEVDRKIQNLSKIMEPIILLFIAAGAVFLILAIYLPVLQINEQLLAS